MIFWYWFPIKDHLKTYPTPPNSRMRVQKNIESENIKEGYPKFLAF